MMWMVGVQRQVRIQGLIPACDLAKKKKHSGNS